MNIFDLDMNSLPEQVQINKEDIKDIKDNGIPSDVQAAKDYTDNHVVDSDHITSGTATSGQVLTADGDGGTAWDTLGTPTIKAANIDSETATSGQVLTADGNGDAAWQNIPDTTASKVDSQTATSGQVLTADGSGGASWETPSGGGGLALAWSGSFAITTTLGAFPITIDGNKKYMLAFAKTSSYPKRFFQTIQFDTDNSEYQLSIVMAASNGTEITFSNIYLNKAGNVKYLKDCNLTTSGMTTNTPGTIYLREIYEVS